MKRAFIIAGLAGFLWLTVAVAAAQEAPQQPVSITADKMELDDQKQVVVFSGSVISKHEDMTLKSDQLRVYYNKGSSQGQEEAGAEKEGLGVGLGGEGTEIDRIEAVGNVKITREDQVAEAHRAVYQAKASPRTIVLTGEPRVWRDKDFLTGKKITLYLDDNRSVVEGGEKKRVNAIFYQSPSPQGKP
jgi:lipopolysaccharide export system protein LptA